MFITDKREFLSDVIVPDLRELLGDYTFTCDRHSRTIYIDVVFKENT